MARELAECQLICRPPLAQTYCPDEGLNLNELQANLKIQKMLLNAGADPMAMMSWGKTRARVLDRAFYTGTLVGLHTIVDFES